MSLAPSRVLPRPGTLPYVSPLFSVLLLALLLLAAPGARAVTLTVTDPGDSGGATQLRQVLANANVGDTVTFAPAVTSITLNGTELSITHGLTVYGPGVTISGNNASRVLDVSGGTSSAPIVLSGLTIENGSVQGFAGGGGLYNFGTVTLTGCTLTGNSADSGGGLLNNGGTVTLTDCTLTQNSAYYKGGGLFNNGGTATLTACTLTGNTASGDAGGGGGLANSGGRATLTDCVFTGNTAFGSGGGGGAIENQGPAMLTGCTLTNNSASSYAGGLYNDFGSATLTDDILYGDTGGEVYNHNSTVTVTYCDIGGGYTGTGILNADPLFVNAPTDLHLQSGSLCAGAGIAVSGLTTDLDGRLRPDPPSIGAYEAAPTGPFSLVVENTSDALPQSLRAAVQCADDYGSATTLPTITFDPAVFTTALTITETSGALTLTAPMTITAPTPGVAVDGNQKNTVFVITGGSSTDPVTLSGLTLQHGAASIHDPTGSDGNDGGGVFVSFSAVAALSGCTLTDNRAGSGGGLVNFGTVTLTGCALTGNSAQFDGGGLLNNGGTVTLTSCTLTSNSASNGNGGGLFNFGTVTLTSCTLTGNSAPNGNGGGLYSIGTATLTACTLTQNSATQNGGGFYNSGTATLTGCTLTQNGSGSGGGIYYNGGSATLTGCALTQNGANSGGGIFNNGGSATLTGCTLTQNSAGFGGGVDNFGTATLTGCTLTGNSATNSGGGLYNDGGTTTLTDDILYGDTAPIGSEVYNHNSTATATYCDIQGGYSGTGNINADPLFVSSTDLHVQPGSPVVGAGIAATGNAVDITGKTRANPPTIGAYEGTAATTSTGVTGNPSPSAVGQSVTFTVTVADTTAPSGPVPTGTVTLSGLPAGAQTLTLSSGQATYSTSGLPVGSNQVTAVYTPSGHNFVTSNGFTTQTVNAATITGLSAAWGTAGAAPLGLGSSLLPLGRNTDVPWLGLKSFTLTLSAPETLAPGDVSVTGKAHGSYGPVTISGSGTSYTVTLASPITAADRVTLSIGNAGIAAFTGTLPVLPGDVNGDGAVGASDLVLARNAVSAPYSVYADINGDGLVNITDYSLIRTKIGTQLP